MESKSNLKKINLTGLEKVLSPKEMKNITGGSYGLCCDYDAYMRKVCYVIGANCPWECTGWCEDD